MLGPLSWVLIYTADLPGMRRFYEGVLGLEVTRDDGAVVVLRSGACTLELMGRLDNGPETLPEARGWARNVTLISFHVEDMAAEVARIEAAGAPSLGGIRPTVAPPGVTPRGRLAQFMDPDGNIIELCDVPLPVLS